MDYSQTLNLPSTSFPMKASLTNKEPQMLLFWEELKVYNLIREKYKGKEKFVLHDGPPYANGGIHVGTALNKILKDIVVKYKTMRGYDSPYLPGWDCHGMPIEHEIIKKFKIDITKIELLEFRKRCKEYALHFVNVQKEQFKRLGVFGEWEHPYLTMDFKYETTIIDTFFNLVKNGFIYKGDRPVLWCINCKTALADAEVEYDEEVSTAVYVKFEIIDSLKKVMESNDDKKSYFLIWTTTPWTLPANLAIALNPEINYSILEIKNEYFILADALVNSVMQKVKINDFKIVQHGIKGAKFEGLKYKHPFIERIGKIILGEHVTEIDGTGCVHTAPGHGEEDFIIGKKYNLEPFSPVDDSGKFTKDIPDLYGKKVFDADKEIVELLRDKKVLLLDEKYSHSYPHCWRCRKPVIYRTTKQWFLKIDNNDLRKKVLNIIPRIKWFPEIGENRIKGMVENRPDWCLSRQRFWGVPIPIVYCAKCEKPLIEDDVFNKIREIVLKEGTDAWFIRNVKEFLPKGKKCPECNEEEFKKEKDILDVWFDSSVSHLAVLKDNKNLSWPADMYLEGSDQHRGWFQVSLITGVAVNNLSPVKIVLTHGYAVDGVGKKMSKSLGNLITGEEACKKYGADIIRLWVASSDYKDDIRFSEEILARLMDAYRKIRNTLRYLLSNLYDFNPSTDKVNYEKLPDLDKYILHRLSEVIKESTDLFEKYEFFKFYQVIYNFCVVDLSAFYLDILKDRMYIYPANTLDRKAGQSVIHEILVNLVKLLAPILTFTSEEVWQELKKLGEKEESIHLTEWPKFQEKYVNDEIKERFTKIIDLRDKVFKLLEGLRNDKIIGHPYEAKVIINIKDENDFIFFKQYENDLPKIFIVSQVILNKEDKFEIKVEKADGLKCERCWNYSVSVGLDEKHKTLCERCVNIIEVDVVKHL
ncbi:MAG: isoleucine--tRNA ligase [Candidatus Firestonebacteria bacterium]